jgi:hypothetical protein
MRQPHPGYEADNEAFPEEWSTSRLAALRGAIGFTRMRRRNGSFSLFDYVEAKS